MPPPTSPPSDTDVIEKLEISISEPMKFTKTSGPSGVDVNSKGDICLRKYKLRPIKIEFIAESPLEFEDTPLLKVDANAEFGQLGPWPSEHAHKRFGFVYRNTHGQTHFYGIVIKSDHGCETLDPKIGNTGSA